jgi:hypothetical protein
MSRFAGWRILLIGMTLALVCAGGAWALVQQLPPGVQVNDDAAKGIDPTKAVSGEAPNSDVVGGSLAATTGKAVPWAIFRQETSTPNDQIFVRSFAGGAWTTRGIGTVGGGGGPTPFLGSLNFDQAQDGEAPAIDFAGAGRATPWATWYEANTIFGGKDQIFASRFDNTTGDPNINKWLFAGQGRPGGATVPSLNIRTNQDAINPSVAGGSAVDPNKPGPWVTWQETTSSPISGANQIFVSKPLGPGQTNCTGVTPAASNPAVAPIGGFCWQQVGAPRVGPGAADPSLNIDTHRDGIEPDIAFTGTSDAVPWVVWYETSTDTPPHTATAGLNNNEMVFAAKGVSDTTAGFGGFHWLEVGSALQAPIDVTDTCALNATNEGQCSLNHSVTADAADPRVAAGTMTPNTPTVPWVAWAESNGTHTQIFVSRLVGTGATAHFEIANNGAAISVPDNNSTRPDITFSGNTPYVSWHEDIGGGVEKGFLGHFVLNGTIPMFQLDESNIPLTPLAQADVRLPISSGCTADPFNADGSLCQGGAVGTPFALFTSGTAPRKLLADAYQPATPTTGTASSVTSSSATVSGSVDQVGAPVNVSFNFGTTTTYDHATAAQNLPPAGGNTPTSTAFAASLTGLASSTTIHYQAVVTTDFGTFLGGDQTLKTLAPPDTTPPKVSAKIVKSTIKKLLSSGKLKVKVTINEAGKVNLSASTSIKVHRHKHKVSLGSVKATFSNAGSKTVKITVPSSAVSKLAALKSAAPIKVSFFGTDTSGNKSKPKKTTAVFPRK